MKNLFSLASFATIAMASSEFNFNAGLPRYTSPSLESNPNITVSSFSRLIGNHDLNSKVEKGHTQGIEHYNLVDKNYPQLWTYTCFNTHQLLSFITPNFLSFCDQAVNDMLVRKVDYFYTPSMTTKGGNYPPRTDDESRPCIGNRARVGCGIFIEGPEGCRRSGEMMWWDYQGIRESANCERTGIKFWDLDATPGHRGKLECRTKVDYVTECDMI